MLSLRFVQPIEKSRRLFDDFIFASSLFHYRARETWVAGDFFRCSV